MGRDGDAMGTRWGRGGDAVGTRWGRVGDALGTRWGRGVPNPFEPTSDDDDRKTHGANQSSGRPERDTGRYIMHGHSTRHEGTLAPFIVASTCFFQLCGSIMM